MSHSDGTWLKSLGRQGRGAGEFQMRMHVSAPKLSNTSFP